mmetsp:Transcript_15708/g.24435  ORF Transcript_15708/g.24435 Transcript_15708/m.24435 type:complete len:100 (+) Transcript_15708:104-403(+)|eukprot:CAMPEP_0195294230 /NCGR_PEP_ID=MMETSP0707-20130614/14400_1 /TAXON_ID=33640 /ORGANISM="Asterionellopsis glacialis, Strain CCMP134" /LENGTH=99 /DNA_ID=CAMNT_0040355139 /DNA_START=43 /DNA_END=342 /DNA_ORIENTATION=-
MPPKVRLPHGLKKDPFDLSRGELVVIAALATSVGAGIYQLATDPWGEPNADEKRTFERWCPWDTSSKKNEQEQSKNKTASLLEIHKEINDPSTKINYEK